MEFDLFSDEVNRNPYPYFAALRQDAPARFDERRGLWIISRYRDIAAFLKRSAQFSASIMGNGGVSIRSPIDGRELPPERTLLASDPPIHTQLRRYLTPFLSTDRIRRFEPQMRATAAQSLARCAPQGECDLIEDICRPVGVASMAELFGFPPERRADLAAWMDTLMLSATASGASGPDLKNEIDQILASIWEEALTRKRNPQDDLLTALMEAETKGEISPAQVLNLCVILLQGGADTTSCLIGAAILALDRRPELIASISADPELLPGLIEESLRFEAPLQSVFRKTRAEADVSGVRIPSGACVMGLLGSANHDESVFEEPEQFRLTGTSTGHLAFGAGPHHCPGASLARRQARVVIETLLTALPGFRLDHRSIEWLQYGRLKLRGPKRMKLLFGCSYPGQKLKSI